MKLTCVNTSVGLVPLGDADHDAKGKLLSGAIYEVDVKEFRNHRFHRKFFALVRLSFEYLTEGERAGFRENVELWRAYITVAAGFADVFFSPSRGEFVEYPKSIAFDKMNESEFGDLYERVKDVVWSIIGERVSASDFESKLSNF